MEAIDMHESRYQYGCSMIKRDQLFPNKQELKDMLSRLTVTSIREVFVKISSPSKYNVKCGAPNFTFYVYAYKLMNEIHWIASIVQNHSCMLQNLGKRHRNLTTSLIMNELYCEIMRRGIWSAPLSSKQFGDNSNMKLHIRKLGERNRLHSRCIGVHMRNHITTFPVCLKSWRKEILARTPHS